MKDGIGVLIVYLLIAYFVGWCLKALRRHVEEDSDMLLHERAEVFDVHTSSISRALKAMKIVKKRAGVR